MFGFLKRKKAKRHAPNPHIGQRAAFFSSESDRFFGGWETHSHSIDYYLKDELTKLRARSRKLVRMTPTGKRFIEIVKSNVAGPYGVKISAQKTRANGKLDKPANNAVEAAFKDWMQYHCDFSGKASFVELQNMAIACAGQDGEFLFEIKSTGKYNFQLKAIDPELLDIDKHEVAGDGQIRLGVEYDKSGKIAWYHFKEKNHNGDYYSGNSYKIKAESIIHGFIPQFPDQSRGIPWMHAGLETAKHLEKYQEGAIVNARATANTFSAIISEGADLFEGDEQEGEENLQNAEAGSILNIGNRKIASIDPDYPHQMYDDFVKSQKRDISAGFGISYHSLSNDLKGVSYSSIRAGVLEDRELFKSLQNWFVRCFVQPVFELWVGRAYLSGLILLPGGSPVSGPLQSYKKAHYQPRRWAWVDPQKDMAANKMYIDERLKSRSQIMREQGDEPEDVWAEIAKEEELMKSLGIQPIPKNATTEDSANAEEHSETEV